MEQLSKYIDSELIMTNLEVVSKEEAIKVLSDKIFEVHPEWSNGINTDTIYESVVARENISTTGIGKGMAFPHIRIDDWGKFVVAIGIVRKGVDFKSVDDIPVKFICLMISSTEEPYIILQTMASIIRFFNQGQDINSFLKENKSSSQIVSELLKSDVSSSNVIIARDMARPVKHFVDLDMTIEELTRSMHLNKRDVLPVVDECHVFKGEISCLEIFEYGLPDFFKQLVTISFVRHIDPFEKYFRIKRNLKVKDFFLKDTKPIKEDTTLVEIIFEMTVRKRSQLFIVDEAGKLIGLIDRFSIIDKILFF